MSKLKLIEGQELRKDLEHAMIVGCQVASATIKRGTLQDSEILLGVDLLKVEAEGCTFHGYTFVEEGGLFWCRIKDGAHMVKSRVRDSDIQNITGYDSHLEGVNTKIARLERCTVERCIIEEESYLEECTLRRCTLRGGGTLRGCTLEECKLEGSFKIE